MKEVIEVYGDKAGIASKKRLHIDEGESSQGAESSATQNSSFSEESSQRTKALREISKDEEVNYKLSGIEEEEGKESTASGSSKAKPSEGSSNLDFTTELNQGNFITVSEVIDSESGEKKILLGISNVRPPTHLAGNKQGDHVTAYISYLHMLISAVEGESVQESANIIAESAKAILPDKANVFDDLLARLQPSINNVVSRDDRRALTQHLKDARYSPQKIEKINENLKISKRAIFMDVTRQIAEKFITEVNFDEEVAFARTGGGDPSAGEREKKAIHTLKVINELEAIKGSGEQADRFDRIHKLCMKISAQYIRGVNIVFEDKEIRAVRKKWGYIKEWDTVIEKREGWEDKRIELQQNELYPDFNVSEEGASLGVNKTKLVNELRQVYNDIMDSSVSSSSTRRPTQSSSSSSSEQSLSSRKVELISKCFGDLFDFKYENHVGAEDPLNLLYKIVGRHLVCMFRAFKELKTLNEDIKSSIMNKFLTTTVLVDQKWHSVHLMEEGSEQNLTVEHLKNGIMSHIDINSMKMLAEYEMEAIGKADGQQLQGKHPGGRS